MNIGGYTVSVLLQQLSHCPSYLSAIFSLTLPVVCSLGGLKLYQMPFLLLYYFYDNN